MSKDVVESVDTFIQSMLNRWRKGCETEDISLLEDVPKVNGNVEFNEFMSELQTRVFSYKPKYLHPDKEDTKETAVLSSRLFARTISLLLKDLEGIIIEMDETKYAVYSFDNQIKVDEYDGDLNEAEFLRIELHEKD